ncbi:MAG: phosphate acyltransferase PlsX [Defluviitaleaceae bacterium]|nr:phosphate acyltransferase PlsX [Defluviitaleaceae bacterium]MCL2240346.1 phosphate acyltransferase PlsX [Defluviitaleaceae bacterium]
MKKMTLAVDTMGGDLGPSAAVEGAFRAAQEFPQANLLLVGPEEILAQEMRKHGDNAHISILHAPEVIDPGEAPTTAIREKKASSIVMGLRAVKNGEAQGFVSAGSTGALLTGATLIIGRQPGIERPALGTLLPTAKGFVLLIDSGANMDCKPAYLLQFGQLGAEYMQKVMGIASPRVGLVNVGAEAEKGNAATKEAYPLLADSGLNFAGNIEGREIPAGAVDVAVCDGFTGNVILKFTEGFAKTMMGMIKTELMATFISKMGALLAKGAFGKLKTRFDYREVGGAPFLGLKSLVVKAHGSSDALAFKNAIRQCVIYNEGRNTHGI